MEEQSKTPSTSNSAKKTKRIYALLAVIVVIALGIVIFKATSSDKGDTAKTTSVAVVHITKSGFEPATISVAPGTKVIWINTDDSLHQVASNPYPKDDGLRGLKSEILNKAQSYEYTAQETGTFGYHDDQHPTINGTLIVQKL